MAIQPLTMPGEPRKPSHKPATGGNGRNTVVWTEVVMLVLMSAPLWLFVLIDDSNGFGVVGVFMIYGPMLLLAVLLSLFLFVIWVRFRRATVVSVVVINILSLVLAIGGTYTYFFIKEYPKQLVREHKCVFCDWPAENTNEMLSQGGTLATQSKEWPESVELKYFHYDGTSEFTTGMEYFAFFFLPYPANQDPTDVRVEDYQEEHLRFRLWFTQSNGQQFSKPDWQSAADAKVSFKSKFPGVGDKGVVIAKVDSFPRVATHVELWELDDRWYPKVLVRRLELEKFHAWRTYIKPGVTQVQNGELVNEAEKYLGDRTPAVDKSWIQPAPVKLDRRRKVLQNQPVEPASVLLRETPREMQEKTNQPVVIKRPRQLDEVKRPEKEE